MILSRSAFASRASAGRSRPRLLRTEIERVCGGSFYKNGVGFADGEHAKKFTDLAEKVIESRKAGSQLVFTSKESSDLRLLFHYFPQYFSLLKSNKPSSWKLLISDMTLYSDECREFERLVRSLLPLHPELKNELTDLSGSLKQGKPLSSAKKALQKLTNKEVNLQMELF